MKLIHIFFAFTIYWGVTVSQTLVFEGGFGEKQYDINKIQNIQFRIDDSLSNQSLSLHTVNGIRQFGLSSIDSLYFNSSDSLRIIQKNAYVEFRSADIDYFSFCPIIIP
ncbi:MAG: hypothetical protein JXR87_05055, partial [Candidatus Marinimicrobia bacterium]|nr:hypothetical protein [Candidatus Neomarinimicrobiota bacterium]